MTSHKRTQEFDIAIVGAGLAGLAAALTAHESGARVVILEAAERIGGRIHAVMDNAGRPIADLGPTWVWPPYQPVVARWIKTLNLTTFDQFNDGDAVIEGYGPEIQRQPLPGQHGMVRISGGPHALTEAIAHRLPDGIVRLNSQVSKIDRGQNGCLRLSIAGERDPVISEQIILAVAPRVAADAISMPSMPESLVQHMGEIPTWMAAQTKVVVLYERAFWKPQGLSGRIASRIGPLHEAHDHTAYNGRAALFGFLDVSAGTWVPETLRAAVLAQLVRCFGPEAAAPSAIIVQDWAKEPLICTERDRMTPSAHPDVANLSYGNLISMAGFGWRHLKLPR